jgi:L-alanine-DL-glutamate epimerase-like enolase superfamily enzyme
MNRILKAYSRVWRLREPFVIARGTMSTAEVVVVELESQGRVGRGEACGVDYHGETVDLMLHDIEGVRAAVEGGANRRELLPLLSAGGARNAIDAALWDLEAKLTGVPAWQRAGMPQSLPVTTACTIGMRAVAAYAEAAAALSQCPWIKIKVDRTDPIAAVEAVHRNAPQARLIVDANQSWSVAEVMSYGLQMSQLGVRLLEQPVAVGQDDSLAGIKCPVPICADESINTPEDLGGLVGRYDFINIKLDKTGGLTAALDLAHAARKAGLRLMTGCMVGGSVAMAPSMVLAQICEINDLDGPWLLAEDWPGGLVYNNGVISPPWPALWG